MMIISLNQLICIYTCIYLSAWQRERLIVSLISRRKKLPSLRRGDGLGGSDSGSRWRPRRWRITGRMNATPEKTSQDLSHCSTKVTTPTPLSLSLSLCLSPSLFISTLVPFDSDLYLCHVWYVVLYTHVYSYNMMLLPAKRDKNEKLVKEINRKIAKFKYVADEIAADRINVRNSEVVPPTRFERKIKDGLNRTNFRSSMGNPHTTHSTQHTTRNSQSHPITLITLDKNTSKPVPVQQQPARVQCFYETSARS